MTAIAKTILTVILAHANQAVHSAWFERNRVALLITLVRTWLIGSGAVLMAQDIFLAGFILLIAGNLLEPAIETVVTLLARQGKG